MDKYLVNIEELRGKDVLAFGTGEFGKRLIPYVIREIEVKNVDVKIHGVSNSRIAEDYAGTFLNTELPVRSLAAWSKIIPTATIIVTVAKKEYFLEIQEICHKAGFSDIYFVSPDYILRMIAADLNWRMMQGIDTSEEYLDELQPNMNPMFRVCCLANEVRDVHKASFSEFKACNENKNVVVLATGPSLNYYTQLLDMLHIGVNASILKEDLQLDYYFLAHNLPWCEKMTSGKCINFVAKPTQNNIEQPNLYFSEVFIRKVNARRFFMGSPSTSIYVDIEHYPLMGFHSIVFPAIQFALYTMPKRIFLVGCDCSNTGHYRKDNGLNDDNYDEKYSRMGEYSYSILKEGYQKLKKFAERYYPEIEIISVNPVGLKGLFRDVYTESYLNAHSEIDRTQVEILDPTNYA